MRCPNISGRVQSGLTSTSSCTAACEAKFLLIVTLGTARAWLEIAIDQYGRVAYLIMHSLSVSL